MYITGLGDEKATKVLQLYENAATKGCGGPEAATLVQARVRGHQERISHISPLYLPYITPVSPLYLP